MTDHLHVSSPKPLNGFRFHFFGPKVYTKRCQANFSLVRIGPRSRDRTHQTSQKTPNWSTSVHSCLKKSFCIIRLLQNSFTQTSYVPYSNILILSPTIKYALILKRKVK
jgi:hypothetical protein